MKGAGVEFDAAFTFSGVIGGSQNLQGRGYSLGGNYWPIGGNLLFNKNGSVEDLLMACGNILVTRAGD